jgi:hypothetical protein
MVTPRADGTMLIVGTDGCQVEVAELAEPAKLTRSTIIAPSRREEPDLGLSSAGWRGYRELVPRNLVQRSALFMNGNGNLVGACRRAVGAV